jgi:hypothetical protein
MVMVSDKRLSQLEPRELADAGHPMDDAFGLEDGEVAVDAARALPGCAEHDLVDRERATRGGERLDEIATGPGVPAVAVGETGRNRFMQVRGHDISLSRY